MRRWGVPVAVVFVALFAVCNGQNGCPEVPTNKDAVVVGHFLSATMSWVKDMSSTDENAVIFEIISTWRRNHTWPCSTRQPFTGPDGRPGLGDRVPIVGISAPEGGNKAYQTANGELTTRLSTGEREYDLTLQVTSYSIQEDWITGVSYVYHSYSKPYAGKTAYFPPHYVASVSSMAETQPYRTTPWTASFSGCCRQYPGVDGSLSFSIYAKVDLSDHIGSPRIISLPTLWLPEQTANTRVYMCAVAAAGRNSMVSMTGGTLNDDQDDNRPVKFEWRVLGGSASAIFEQGQDPTVASNCHKLIVAASYTAAARPLIAHDYIKVAVSLGSAEVVADLLISVLPQGTQAAPSPQFQNLPFSCQGTDECQVRMSLGFPLDMSVALGSSSSLKTGNLSYWHGPPPNVQSPLEVRYVIGNSGMQTGVMATSDARIKYSLSLGGLDHAGLPGDATLAPVSKIVAGCNSNVVWTCPGNDERTSCLYVSDIAVSFSSSKVNSRPLHDVPYEAENRDHSSVVGMSDPESSRLSSQGFTQVSNSNFNAASGGATIGVWMKRNLLDDAVTDLRIVNVYLH